jgi:hypothetical protein
MKAKHFLLASALLLWTGVLEAQTYQVPVSEKNEKMQEGEFEPTWESLQNYKVPEWFRNAKFGIWAHWGPQCVEGSGDWMARSLYLEGSREYKHHVEHVGITDLQLENLKWIIDHSEPGTVESVLNFCHYCLNDEKLTDYLDYFESKNIGIINASPLSMGLLSQRGVPAWHPAPQSLVEACRKAVQHCLSKNYPIEKLAIQYSVSNPRIATTLFSSANPDNVLKNITYAEEPIDWNLVKEVQEIIGEQMRVSWANS